MLSRRAPLRQQGFTMVELMIAVTVLAILLSVGLPSFQAWIVNARIRTTTEAMQNGLQLARSEAVKRNTRVRFILNGGTGWIVQTNDGTEIQRRPSGEGSSGVTVAATPNGATQVTFNALGMSVFNTDASLSILSLEMDVPTTILPAAQSRELRITVASSQAANIPAGGQIRMCDPYFAAAGDPRSC